MLVFLCAPFLLYLFVCLFVLCVGGRGVCGCVCVCVSLFSVFALFISTFLSLFFFFFSWKFILFLGLRVIMIFFLSNIWSFRSRLWVIYAFKVYERSPKDMWDLPCLLYLLFWFHVSNYRNVWNNERWKSCIKYLSIMKLFHLQKPLSKWR